MQILIPFTSRILKSTQSLLKIALLFTVLLLAIKQGRAQVYYTTNNEIMQLTDNGRSLVTSGFISPPSLFYIDHPKYRAFVCENQTYSSRIKTIRLSDGGITKTITLSSIGTLTGLKYDPVNDYIYFIGIGTATYIYNSFFGRVKPDGTGLTILGQGFCAKPYGLVIDTKLNRAFVYNNVFAARAIITLNLSTGVVSEQFTPAVAAGTGVSDMAYNPEDGFLYVLCNGGGAVSTDGDQLFKVRPDGSDHTVIKTKIGLNAAPFMATDFGHDKIYFADGVSVSNALFTVTRRDYGNAIKSIDIKSGVVQTLASAYVVGLHYPELPKLSPTEVSNVTSSTITLGGNIASSPLAVTERGVVFSSIKTKPVIGDSVIKQVIGSGIGSFSTSITDLSQTTTYYARAYATSQSGTAYGDVVTFTTKSNNADLSGLALSVGSLNETFSKDSLQYTVSVGAEVSSIAITPTVAQNTAVIKVNGTTVVSGQMSGNISLANGLNTITMLVTASDGIAKKTYNIVVNRARYAQTISFGPMANRIYGDAAFPTGATSSRNTQLVYTSSNPEVAIVRNNNVIIAGAGSTVITASHPGDAENLPAESVSQALIVTKVPLIIALSGILTKVYGDADPNIGYTIKSGTLKNGDQPTGALSRAPGTDVGTYAVNMGTLDFGSSYDVTLQSGLFTIAKRAITIKPDALSKTYGDADPELTYTLSAGSIAPGANINDEITGALSRVPGQNAGRYLIGIGTLAGRGGNYNITFALANFIINKAQLVFTANPLTREYGKTTPVATGTVTGFVNGENMASATTGSLSFYTNSTQLSAPGIYSITGSGLSSTNYGFIQAPTNNTALTIVKARVTYKATPVTQTYSKAIPAFTGIATGFTTGMTMFEVSGTLKFTTTAVTGAPAGTYAVNGSGLVSAVYDFVQDPANSTAFTIEKAKLYYNADAATRALNTPNPEITGTVTGFVNGENLASATTGTVSFNTDANMATPVGVYPITGSGLSANNYDILQAAGNASALTINLSTNGNLSNLAVSEGALSPSFAPGKNNYMVTVASNIESIKITPTLSDANARVRVNNTEIVSGSQSSAIPLALGLNTINVNVTAQDGETTNPYTITVNRPPSTDATLTAFNISEGTLSPAFNADTTVYTASVASEVTSFNLTVAKSYPDATITINDQPYVAGATYQLLTGYNNYNVKVTAQDGTTIRLYALSILREYSANNNLASLTVVTGTLSPAFDPAQTSYTVNVGYNVKSVDITPVTQHIAARLNIGGYYQPSGALLNQVVIAGDNAITIPVVASNGNIKNYVITINRAQSADVSLASLDVYDASLSPKVLPVLPELTLPDTSYTLNIPAEVNSVYVKPLPAGEGATVTVNGNALNYATGNIVFVQFGNTPVTIVVKAQDGTTQTYNLSIHRPLSSNALLSSLGFNLTDESGALVVPLSPSFDPNVNYYTAYLSNPAITGLGMNLHTGSENATLTINGTPVTAGQTIASPILKGGLNHISVKVKSQDESTENVYVIALTRAPSTEARLSSIIISGNNGYSHAPLNPPGENTTISVPNYVNKLFVMPRLIDPAAVIKLNGADVVYDTAVEVQLGEGDNPINIVATAADGTTSKMYALLIKRLPFADITLTSLGLNKGTVSPVFNPATLVYNVVLPFNADSAITMAPVATSPTAVINIAADTISSTNPSVTQALGVGIRQININVTAADGVTSQIYRVRVTRPGPTANLSNIILSKGTISPAFSRVVYNYTASVDYNTSTIAVTPLTGETKAVIKVNGITITSAGPSAIIPLNVGANAITTVITSSDGLVTQTYTITVTRADKSANANLDLLAINNSTLSPVFNSNTISYTASVNYSVNNAFVIPVTADTTATVAVNDTVTTSGIGVPVALNVGSNTITTVVTAQNGSTAKTYTVLVNRHTAASNADLTGLTLSNGTLSPVFNTAVLSYSTTIPIADTSIVISPFAADVNADIKINGRDVDLSTGGLALPLSPGTNVVSITVKAQDSTTVKIYTLTITRSSPLIKAMTLNPSTTITAIPGTLEYTATIDGGSATTVKLAVQLVSSNLQMTINGNVAKSGVRVDGIPVAGTGTDIPIVITGADGIPQTYVLHIKRKPSNNAELASIKIDGLTLTKASATSYTATITGTVLSEVSQTVTTAHVKAKITVNGDLIASGAASAPLPLQRYGTTVITTVITAEDGVTTKTYTVSITRKLSNLADLASLKVSSSTVTKVNATTYTATVEGAALTQVNLKAVTTHAGATMTVNGMAQVSGTTTPYIALNADPRASTPIAIEVTAEDGITTKTITVNVIRKLSNDVSLSGLAVSSATVVKTGGSVYTATINGSILMQVNMKATATNAGASMTVNGTPQTSGTTTPFIVLNATGTTAIAIEVTAEDGTTTKTYTVNVVRQFSNVAKLQTLRISEANLTSTGAFTFTAVLPATSTLTAVKQQTVAKHAGASITVNGTPVVNGGTTDWIPLDPSGTTVLTTVITAEDGTTKKTYTVTVIKQEPIISRMALSSRPPAGNDQLVNQATSQTASGIKPNPALSPNGDGITDYFEIGGIESYADNTVTIVNQGGATVYQAKGYDNKTKVFDGHSSINGALQPQGTYFYVIDYKDGGNTIRKTGYLIIKY